MRKFLLAWIGCLCAAGLQGAEPRYNVLFIIADDLRCALGCYGDAQAKTPNIDRLAARGVRFDRAYVQYPVCNPSRTSFLTSTRPERNGITGNQFFFRDKMPGVVTLPELFRAQGGRSFSYGKIFHAGLVEGIIETNMLDAGRSWDEARMFRPTAKGSSGPVRNLTGGALPWCRVGDMEGEDADQSDGQTALRSIEVMERKDGKRWFIGAGFHRPHDPFVVSARYVAQFPSGSLKLHRDPPDATPMPRLAHPGAAFQKYFDQFTDEDRMAYLTHYYAGVTQTDAQVGRLMDTMDRLKLWDQTVVIFIGDHGFHLGEKAWWNKSTLFELSCRAPCIIAAPGFKPGVSRSLVEFLDLYPTIAELCGLPLPRQVEGKSLAPLLSDPARKIHDYAMTYVTRGANASGFSIRTDRWRYTQWSDGSAELYDHANDDGEWRNLASDPRHGETVAALRKLIPTR